MSFPLPPDYHERVYAGVLGKLIGVYSGRPFEQWPHEKIEARWGEVRCYINEDCGVPLIVADDDITGTFTFLRALRDHGSGRDLSSREIGQTWLNYIAENRHILWWGGIGMSTEHTAYLRLAGGVPAPESGSIALNGKAVAEEIGSQIFIDGWAMVAPGQPELTARLAREAARVSHDGEAVHGAVVLAVMESLAFVESNLETLLDRALSHVPSDCEIARMIADVRAWKKDGADWRESMRRLRAAWGYERYNTNCPMVSNHGVIIVALLHGGGDFDESLMIANTAGYDTDCNAGNVGCLLGIRGGLAAVSGVAYDWRTPVNDRLFLPTAAGHDGVSDAATVACEVINVGRALAGLPPYVPKNGARFHFDLPGSTHGFAPVDPDAGNAMTRAGVTPGGERVLVLTVTDESGRAKAEVATFLRPDSLTSQHYAMAATPALYPGQEIAARVAAGAVGRARLFVRSYQQTAGLRTFEASWQELASGREAELRWTVPATDGWPVVAVGVEWEADARRELALRSLTWTGQPELTLQAPAGADALEPWTASFVHNVDLFAPRWLAPFNLAKNRGIGIVHTGGRDWRDYQVSAEIKPILGEDFGVVARVQGLTRYYGLIANRDGHLRLVRVCHDETVLAEVDFDWPYGETHRLALSVAANRLVGAVDGRPVMEATDDATLLDGGSAGWRINTGRVESGPLEIRRVLVPGVDGIG